MPACPAGMHRAKTKRPEQVCRTACRGLAYAGSIPAGHQYKRSTFSVGLFYLVFQGLCRLTDRLDRVIPSVEKPRWPQRRGLSAPSSLAMSTGPAPSPRDDLFASQSAGFTFGDGVRAEPPTDPARFQPDDTVSLKPGVRWLAERMADWRGRLYRRESLAMSQPWQSADEVAAALDTAVRPAIQRLARVICTCFSKTATRLRSRPKILKNSFQKLCAEARSESSSAHRWEKLIARLRISFQDKGMFSLPYMCGSAQTPARRLLQRARIFPGLLFRLWSQGTPLYLLCAEFSHDRAEFRISLAAPPLILSKRCSRRATEIEAQLNQSNCETSNTASTPFPFQLYSR